MSTRRVRDVATSSSPHEANVPAHPRQSAFAARARSPVSRSWYVRMVDAASGAAAPCIATAPIVSAPYRSPTIDTELRLAAITAVAEIGAYPGTLGQKPRQRLGKGYLVKNRDVGQGHYLAIADGWERVFH